MNTRDIDKLGGRLPLREPSTITGQQRELYDSMVDKYVPWAEKAGFKMVTSDGRLIGPFNSFLLNPEITKTLLAFDEALKKFSSLSERVREVVILAVGSVWGAKYEMYSHSILARSAGLPDEAIKSLISGELPTSLPVEELLAARIGQEMSRNHRIDDAMFTEAEKTFGKQGLYEMATLIGEFSVTCTVLNLFDIPIPEFDI